MRLATIMAILSFAGTMSGGTFLVELAQPQAGVKGHQPEDFESVVARLRAAGAEKVRPTKNLGWVLVTYRNGVDLAKIPGVKRVFQDVQTSDAEHLPFLRSWLLELNRPQGLDEPDNTKWLTSLREKLKAVGATHIDATRKPDWILIQHPTGRGLESLPEVKRVFSKADPNQES